MDAETFGTWSLRKDRPHVAPPNFIPHNEPICNMRCVYEEPHRHGFSCHKDCPDCGGICHISCPAYKES